MCEIGCLSNPLLTNCSIWAPYQFTPRNLTMRPFASMTLRPWARRGNRTSSSLALGSAAPRPKASHFWLARSAHSVSTTSPLADLSKQWLPSMSSAGLPTACNRNRWALSHNQRWPPVQASCETTAVSPLPGARQNRGPGLPMARMLSAANSCAPAKPGRSHSTVCAATLPVLSPAVGQSTMVSAAACRAPAAAGCTAKHWSKASELAKSTVPSSSAALTATAPSARKRRRINGALLHIGGRAAMRPATNSKARCGA
mmetsp:Transcript_38748/g.111377  ORF Transcript_38748/g.111377 Transcript_38748/m.111377 type:complete len:257 (+) Transcript_38748:50-820(+)